MKKELHLGVIFTGKLDDSFRKAINTIKGELGDLAKTIDKVGDAQARQTEGLNPLKKHLNAYIDNIKKLIYWQAQWYGAKAVLFASLGIPTAVIASTVKYSAAIDEARANLLRWEATSGKVTKEMVAQNEKLLMAIRTTTTEYPIAFSELAKAAEAFLGANVKVDTVTDMIPMIAQLKTSFKEIDFEQFAISTTGAFNVFRDTLVKSGKEVIGFQALFEKLMLAQKEGIIRPEEFTKVIQYMGQMSKLAGFNVDQMLALSVAVTNTGQKATSAARLLQGLFQSFSTKTTVKHLNEFAEAAGKAGIKVDKSKTLASQFYDIIGQLGKLLNPDGTLNIGAAQFMNLLTSSDRSRILQTLIPHLSEAIKLAEKLKDSAGNLQTVSDIMRQPIGAQWQIFKNILNEMTVSINGDTIPALQAITGWLVDVARGALYALDPTDRFKGKLDNLGEAGRNTYAVVQDLRKIFETLWDVLKPILVTLGAFIKTLLDLTVWLSKNTYLIQMLANLLMAKLVLSLINTVGRVTGLNIAFSALSKIMAGELVLSLASVGKGLATFGVAILNFIKGPLGLLTIGITSINLLFDHLNKRFDAIEKRDSAFNFKIEGLNEIEALNAEIVKSQQKVADLKKELTSTTSGRKHEWGLTGAKVINDEMAQENYELARLIAKRNSLLREQTKLRDKGVKPPVIAPPKVGDDGSGKKAWDKSFSSYNAELTAAMQAERSYYQMRLALLENMLKLGVISEEKYYAAKAVLREKDLKLEQDAIDAARAQLEKDEEVQIRLASKKYGTNSEFVKALKAKFEAERDKLNTKEIQLKNRGTVEESKDITERQLKDREEYLKSIKEANDQELSLAKIAAEQKLDILEQERTLAERNLRDGLINESQYYKEIERIIIASYETRQKLRDLEYEAQKKVLEQELKDAGVVVEKVNEVNRKLAELQRKHNEETVKADLAKNQEIIKNNQAAADDLEVIWQEHYDGFSRLVNKAITDSAVQWKKWGKTIYNATKEALDAMKDQFSNFFEDFLNGELKTAEDYFAAFGKSINKILADSMAQGAMGIITSGGNGGLLGWLFGGSSSSSSFSSSGGTSILGSIGGFIGSIFGEEGKETGASWGNKISEVLFGTSSSGSNKDDWQGNIKKILDEVIKIREKLDNLKGGVEGGIGGTGGIDKIGKLILGGNVGENPVEGFPHVLGGYDYVEEGWDNELMVPDRLTTNELPLWSEFPETAMQYQRGWPNYTIPLGKTIEASDLDFIRKVKGFNDAMTADGMSGITSLSDNSGFFTGAHPNAQDYFTKEELTKAESMGLYVNQSDRYVINSSKVKDFMENTRLKVYDENMLYDGKSGIIGETSSKIKLLTGDGIENLDNQTDNWIEGLEGGTNTWLNNADGMTGDWLTNANDGTNSWIGSLQEGTDNWLSSLANGVMNYVSGADSGGWLGTAISLGTSLLGGSSGSSDGYASNSIFGSSYATASGNYFDTNYDLSLGGEDIYSGKYFKIDPNLYHSGGLIMHSGGIVPELVNSMISAGLKSDERRIIGQVGERVLSRDQNKIFEKLAAFLDNPNIGNNFSATVPVSIENNKIEINKQIVSMLRNEIEKIVMQVLKRTS